MLRLLGYFFGIGTVLGLIVIAGVALYVNKIAQSLPDYEVLEQYSPPVTSRIHASDGQLMAEYARERRLYLPIQAIPDRVKAAFLAAEDKQFYRHGGVDFPGVLSAVVTNARNWLSGANRRPVGASTITQQVAKNFLLTNRQSYERKIAEMILAFRIEEAYSKDRILELYLNEIFFGEGAYGIAGAALTYFNKSVNELTIEEAAYLASLPKGPSNYHPFKHKKRATIRRNWVIGQMVANGFITYEEGQKAKETELAVNIRPRGTYLFASEYFTEEVRREIIERFGADGLYEGGLSIRTTLDPQTQIQARTALHNGLIGYDIRRGYRGPIAKIDVFSGDWGVNLAEVEGLYDVPEWRVAVVLDVLESGLSVGFKPSRLPDGRIADRRDRVEVSGETMKWARRYVVDDKTLTAKNWSDVFAPGDVVYVQAQSDGEGNSSWRLRQVPAISGALVAMDPHTGRVLAMAGGFSYAQSEFNRATQAYRQPGSSFKPFVYAAALDNGYTPASVVNDAAIQIRSGGELWEPKNYGGGSGAGPSTLRMGIERSRNLMTVRLAKDMGMSLVAEYAERFGIYDKLSPVLAMSLGSGETTVMRMVSAYSVIANGGKQIKPSIIDRIQDRYGQTIFRHDERGCDGCTATAWLKQPEPELIDNREQVLDPMTAYQITSMMEGVVQRGTATKLKALGRPVAGKTGTTNDEKDAWFVGFTPSLVVGVYLGFDQPKPMGRGSTGGELAAPVFMDFMKAYYGDAKPETFEVPDLMTLVAINRKTGMQAKPGGKGVIMEAFKPGTGPADTYSVIGLETATASRAREISPRANRVLEQSGGSTGGLW